jgi:hypothetical protein
VGLRRLRPPVAANSSTRLLAANNPSGVGQTAPSSFRCSSSLPRARAPHSRDPSRTAKALRVELRTRRHSGLARVLGRMESRVEGRGSIARGFGSLLGSLVGLKW